MSVNDIRDHLEKKIYQTEVSPDPISQVTNWVLDEVSAWQVGRWTRFIRLSISMR
jgi:transposase-like protein